MCAECIWHQTFLVQLYSYLAIKLCCNVLKKRPLIVNFVCLFFFLERFLSRACAKRIHTERPMTSFWRMASTTPWTYDVTMAVKGLDQTND